MVRTYYYFYHPYSAYIITYKQLTCLIVVVVRIQILFHVPMDPCQIPVSPAALVSNLSVDLFFFGCPEFQ